MLKLRFDSNKGLLMDEDLWDLSLSALNIMAKKLNKEIKAIDEEDFLGITSSEDKIAKLKFDIVLRVMEVKKAEKELRVTATERKAEREKIMGVLARKKDDALETFTVEELMKKLEDLK